MELWRDLQEILPPDALMTVGQLPPPPAGSTAPQRHDEPANRFSELVLTELGLQVDALNEAKKQLSDALQALSEKRPSAFWVCHPVEDIKNMWSWWSILTATVWLGPQLAEPNGHSSRVGMRQRRKPPPRCPC
jgi:hypothetical protein